jgi:hypothetical protein
MKNGEPADFHPKQKMKKSVKKVTGVIGRQIFGGFDRNDREPQSGGNPDLQYLFMRVIEEWIFRSKAGSVTIQAGAYSRA